MKAGESLKAFVAELEAAMSADLQVIGADHADMVANSSRAMTVVAGTLAKLREFIKSYTFADEAEEINFFKKDKPTFLSHYYFHEHLRNLSLAEIINMNQGQEVHCREALASLRDFNISNSEFSEYMTAGFTHLDDRYFRRGFLPAADFKTDREFSTGYDDLLGRLIASTMMKVHIHAQFERSQVEELKSPLKWTGSKADLIEVVYGLETMGVINGGDADLKEIVRAFEGIFNVNLGNVYRQYLDIRLRKKEKTTFLNQMKERLETRINNFS